MAEPEGCFCKGSTQLRKTCLLMLKLLRSLTMNFRNETFEEIAKEMDTDVESLFCLYQQISLSKKFARQLGDRPAIDDEDRLRRERKKRKRERSGNVVTSEQPAKRARVESGKGQDVVSAIGASAEAMVVVPNLKEQDETDASTALDHGVDIDRKESAAIELYGSSFLDQLEAELERTREAAYLDEDNLP